MILRQHAEAIWRAGVTAVDSASAVRHHIQCSAESLRIAQVELPLQDIGQIEIIGAGKAGAGMAEGIESVLLECLPPTQFSGWVNVPADCVRPLQRIHLHAARPAGINEPTSVGVEGTVEILRRAGRLTSRDVCIVLLSGGASALLCSPVPDITLADKLAVTRALAASGAPIHELNLVRTQLSQVKGGKLAAACHARILISLIISDVIGDPLEVIGSGPTVPTSSKAQEAIDILNRRQLSQRLPESVMKFLRSQRSSNIATTATTPVHNVVVASNSLAIEAAAIRARQLGYQVQSLGSANAGDAAAEGRHLMQQMLSARSENTTQDAKPLCILSGGEPTVQLNSLLAGTHPETQAGSQILPKGGRNQELVLAAMAEFPNPSSWQGLAMLSGGTDGEDGPTDAAGAFCDEALICRMAEKDIDPASFLAQHNSYYFFDALDGLLRTGPTHTNVMDLRVALVQNHACGN